MASLRDLQSAFASAVRFGDAGLVAPFVVDDGIDAERRVGIYANNVRENFLATLEATFPVLVRLAGRDWLRQNGTAYLRTNPSRSGNLHYVGERYAAFLESGLAGTPYAYFADVARLEWAYQEVLVAAEPGSLDLASLATIAPERQGEIVFGLSLAARLVTSAYPLLAIWKANQPGAADDGRTIRLDEGPSRVLVIRRSDHVELRELPEGEFEFLAAVARACTVESAAAAARQADPSFDLPTSLVRLLRLGPITDWSTPR